MNYKRLSEVQSSLIHASSLPVAAPGSSASAAAGKGRQWPKHFRGCQVRAQGYHQRKFDHLKNTENRLVNDAVEFKRSITESE